MNKVLLSLMVFLLNCNILLPIADYSVNNSVILGKTYLNLDNKEWIGETVISKFTILNVVVNETIIRLKGRVHYNGKSQQVYLSGELKQSSVLDNSVTATLTDQSGNFEAVHFSISEITKYDGNVLLNQPQYGQIFRLYLLKPYNRELSIFEGKINNIRGYHRKLEGILKNKDNYNQADAFGTDFWLPLVFEPRDGGTSIVEEPSFRRGSRGEVSIMGDDIAYVSRRKKIFKYWETYSANAFCDLTYWIEGTVKAVVSDGKGGVAIDLTDKYTTSNCPYYQRDDSPFGIGLFEDPVQMSVVTNGYDSFVDMSMTATNEQAKNGSLTVVRFGVGVSYRGVNLDTSMDLAYTESSKLAHFPRSLSAYEEPEEDQWPHKLQGRFSNVMLMEEGGQLYLTGSIRSDHDDHSMKYVHARTRFVISARYDGSWSWRYAAIPGDREFNIFVWDYRS